MICREIDFLRHLRISKYHLRLNLEGVIAGHIHATPPQPGVAGYPGRAMFSLCLPGAPHYSYERLQPVLKKNERTACHEYIRSLSPALRSCKDEELQEFSYHLPARSRCLCQCGRTSVDGNGEPVMVDTALEPRLSVSFQTGCSARLRHLVRYGRRREQIWFPTSSMPPGAEEEADPHLLGPVGGGKSSLAERQRGAARAHVLSANGGLQSNQRHPLCLFNPQRKMHQILQKKSTASRPAISAPLCRRGRPSACTSLAAISRKFRVVKVWPSILEQVAIAKRTG